VASCPMGRTLHLLLVCPEAELATAAVYRGVTVPAQPQDGLALRQALAAGDLEELGNRLHNRLQPVAEKLCPDVAALYARLGAAARLGRLMSGSGTSLFALCRNRSEAIAVARRLRSSLGWQKSARPAGRGLRLFLVRSCV
jgi:4-diphosphocytidyl-2-C-methyl-D-erythritol kinase